MNYKGEVPQDSKKMIKLLKSGDVTESGLTVTSAVSSVTIGKQILPSREYRKQYTQKSH